MTWNDDTPRKRRTKGQMIMLLAAAILITALVVALIYSVPANGQELPPMPTPISVTLLPLPTPTISPLATPSVVVTLLPLPTPTFTPDDVVIFTFVYLPEVRR